MSNVFIIILNWNRKDDTLACLESLNTINLAGNIVNIVVVDNGSTDNSRIEIKKTLKKMTFHRKKINGILIKNKSNLGFAAGNNTGIQHALKNGADYVLLLNNDTVVDKDFLVTLVHYAENRHRFGLGSPKLYFAPGYEFHKERYSSKDLGKVIWYAGGDMDWNNIYGSNHGVDEVDHGKFDTPTKTDFATGACMLIHREVLEKVGMFDPNYFMYLEDADLSVRVRQAGYDVWFIPQSVVWHKVAQSSGIGSDLNDYYITRNRMLFGLKYASFRTKIALVRESARLLFHGRPWQQRGIKDYYFSNFGKGSWGKR